MANLTCAFSQISLANTRKKKEAEKMHEVMRSIIGLKKGNWQEDGETCIIRSFVIRTRHQILLAFQGVSSTDSVIYFVRQLEESATGWKARIRFSAVQRFSLLHSAQTALGPTQAPTKSEPAVLSPWVKTSEHEADHLSPSRGGGKESGATSPLPHMPSWHSA
jgi:hypothetical protein